jgi:DNA-binding IscR family transcriptional regulator
LKKDPAQVKVATIVRIVNGPIAMLPCVSLNFYKRCDNCDEQACGLHDIMINVRDATLNVLETKMLTDLLPMK